MAGVAPARVGSIPQVAFAAVALLQPKLRPLKDTSYQFTRPFIMESDATTRAFDIKATDLDTALEATIEAARAA